MNTRNLVWQMCVTAMLCVCGISAESSAQVAAEKDTTARLLACDPITDPAEKMACFDAVVKSIQSEADDRPAEVTDSPRPAVAPDSEVAESAAPAEVDAAPVARGGATAVAVPAKNPRADPQVAPDDAPAEVPVSGAAPGATAAGSPVDVNRQAENYFGLEDSQTWEATERVREVLENMESISATIEDVWPTIDDRFEVRLDNGQVWRETTSTRVRMPKAGSSVEISRASLGSFRMKVNNDNRLAGVRRTR